MTPDLEMQHLEDIPIVRTLMRSTLFRLAREKRRRVQMAGALRVAVLTINATAVHAKARASNLLAKASRPASHGPRVRAKEEARKTRERPQENPKVSRERNTRTKVKALQKADQALNSTNQTQPQSHGSEQTYSDDNPYTDSPWCDNSWNCADWDDGWSAVGWHEGWDQTYDNSACYLSLGSFDLRAMSSPKRFEWVRINLDTGAAVDTFPLIFGPKKGWRCKVVPNSQWRMHI